MSVFRVTLRYIEQTRNNEDFTAIMFLVICFSILRDRQTDTRTTKQPNKPNHTRDSQSERR